MSQTIELHKVEISTLKKFLSKSSDLTGGALNFLLEEHQISSIANNEGDSFFKRWSVPMESVAELGNFPEGGKIKVSLNKGSDFINNILKYFGNTCSIRVSYDNGSAIMLTVYNEKLTINIVAAPTELNYDEYDTATLDEVFFKDAESIVAKFSLSAGELKEISSLSKISSNPETQTSYVSIYTDNGQLKATDNAFDVVLHNTESDFEARINIKKEFFSNFCAEEQQMSVKENTAISSMTLYALSAETNTESGVVLMDEVSADASQIDDLAHEFNWADSDEEQE